MWLTGLSFAQPLEDKPVAGGGNPEGVWLADQILLQVYTAPELAFLAASLAFGGDVSGRLDLHADGSYSSDYIVTATVVGNLGLLPVDLAISDTSRSMGDYSIQDSLLVLGGGEGALPDSILFTASADTLHLIESVSLGSYRALVEQLAPGASSPLSVLRLHRDGAEVREGASAANFDGDGRVGFGDFLLYAGSFGKRMGDPEFSSEYDLTGDGNVDFEDFLTFVSFFGALA